MTTHVLIVEGDAALSARMRGTLEERGFSVQETPDGRTCLEVARQAQPACVILAVDLPAGQNGYILCGKFKKDDDLRALPVAIVGSPEGFAQHGKLKNRADAYLAKPLQFEAFAERIIELTGHVAPDAHGAAPAPGRAPPDADEATVTGDPDLDLIDAAFDTGPVVRRAPSEPPPLPSARATAPPTEDSAFASLDSLGGERTPAPVPEPSAEPHDLQATPIPDGSSRTDDALGPPGDAEHATYDLGVLTPAPGGELDADTTGASVASGDGPEALRTEVARLQSALEDAQARSFSSDVRIHQLEAELAGRAAVEEEASPEGRPQRDQILRRDREIVRLKSDLHGREQELSDLREQAMRLEQQALEATGELARRDAQIKALQSRGEQERRRMEESVERAETATREAQDQAVEFQAAVEAASARADAAEQEAADLRAHAASVEQARDQAEGELAAARRDRELHRAHADGAQRQLDELRSALEQTQSDLTTAREQLSLRDAARDDELGGLQQRVRELEGVARKHEERVARLYTRLKSEERAREKAARAVAVASQLLTQSSPGAPAAEKNPSSDDESAAASR